ncbi:TPA: hypothetical protein ACJXEA_001807 [Legionella pneumophila subsp. fraseri]
MVRPLRIEFAGGLYHITSRGNRKAIYLSDEDREAYRVRSCFLPLSITRTGSDLALCLYP